MKVYVLYSVKQSVHNAIVTQWDNDFDQVLGVFSSKKEAEKHADSLNFKESRKKLVEGYSRLFLVSPKVEFIKGENPTSKNIDNSFSPSSVL